MTGYADLAGQNDVFADGGGSGEADLGAKQRIGAYGRAVADLDEVVDLGAEVDAGLADGGAVDAGVGLDLDVVFDDCSAGLQDLVPGAVRLAGEAEAVGPDDSAVLQDDVVAEATVLAYDGVGVGEEVIAGAGVGVEDDVGEDGGVVADGDVVSDDGIGSDVGVGPDVGGGGDGGGGVDARWVGWGLVEELDGEGEGEVGVFDAERGGGDRRGSWVRPGWRWPWWCERGRRTWGLRRR